MYAHSSDLSARSLGHAPNLENTHFLCDTTVGDVNLALHKVRNIPLIPIV